MTAPTQAGDTTMMSPAAVLDRMLNEVLVTADDWCQGGAARNAAGTLVPCFSDLAVRFCVVGALQWALGKDAFGNYWDVFAEASQAITTAAQDSISTWNDSPHTTFEDVRLVLKQARENLS